MKSTKITYIKFSVFDFGKVFTHMIVEQNLSETIETFLLFYLFDYAIYLGAERIDASGAVVTW